MEEQQEAVDPVRGTPTVSDKTRRYYLKVIHRWKRRIQDRLGLEDLYVTADMVIDDLIERHGEWKQNSIRLYRAALREWIKGERFFSEQEARRLLARIEDTKEKLHGKGVASGRRAIKGIQHEDWLAIERQIKLAKSGFEYIAGQMLLASLHTGMRPAEWENAKFTGEWFETLVDMELGWPRYLQGSYKQRQVVPVMFIRNAKATNGRGRWGVRYVPVPLEVFEPIKRVLAHIREYKSRGGRYESWLNGVSRGCARIMKKAFPRRKLHYTIYNCRHQYSAELKACNLPKSVVAELMGHTSEETAGEHYAKKKSAWKLTPMFRQAEQGPPSFLPRNSREDTHSSTMV